jgi:hypothetical protein
MSALASTLTLLRAEEWHRGGNLEVAELLGQYGQWKPVARVVSRTPGHRSPPLRHHLGAEEGQGGGRWAVALGCESGPELRAIESGIASAELPLTARPRSLPCS